MRLLLFDIDGTLLDSGGAGTRSLDRAFREVFSIEHAFGGIAMAGKTDVQIIREALHRYGLPSDNGVIPALIGSYLKHLDVEINNERRHIKPGVCDMLDRLSGTEDFCLGLLTGNIEEGARIKLGAFDLVKYFKSRVPSEQRNIETMLGAFGSDDEDRAKLLPIAVKKFKDAGVEASYRDCVVIGDTPLDVLCAKPYGSLSIGVATGPYTEEHLRMAGADVVMPNLSDTEALLGAIAR